MTYSEPAHNAPPGAFAPGKPDGLQIVEPSAEEARAAARRTLSMLSDDDCRKYSGQHVACDRAPGAAICTVVKSDRSPFALAEWLNTQGLALPYFYVDPQEVQRRLER